MAILTPKQQRFCDEYLIDLNATQAAIRAGYSKKTANRIGPENLSKPAVKEYIQKRMDEKEEQLIANQDEVLKYLTAVLRGDEQDEQITTIVDGETQRLKVRRQANQIKAAELLGKRYGLYVEKIDNNQDLNININIDYGDE